MARRRLGPGVAGALALVTMLGLTAMRLMGLEKGNWGTGSNATQITTSTLKRSRTSSCVSLLPNWATVP